MTSVGRWYLSCTVVKRSSHRAVRNAKTRTNEARNVCYIGAASRGWLKEKSINRHLRVAWYNKNKIEINHSERVSLSPSISLSLSSLSFSLPKLRAPCGRPNRERVSSPPRFLPPLFSPPPFHDSAHRVKIAFPINHRVDKPYPDPPYLCTSG